MKKTKLILNLLAVVFLAGTVPAVAAAELHLIPWPARITQRDGQFALNDQTAVVADHAFAGEAAALSETLHLTNTASASKNRIELTTRGAQGQAEEA